MTVSEVSITALDPYCANQQRRSPFHGSSARKCNGGLGTRHPVLAHTFPACLLQVPI